MTSRRDHAPLTPCDVYSEQVHLLVDRELGPAEEAVVEEHLQGCPRCQLLVGRLERMSSVLKAWDAETNEHEPPEQRLRNTVLARVAEQSTQRRRAGRRLNLLHFATAACVLIGLGLGVGLGLRAIDVAPPAPREIADEIADPAALPADAQDEGMPLTVSPDLLAVNLDDGHPAERIPPSTAPTWELVEVLDDGSVGRLAFLAAQQSHLAAFSQRVGAPATRVYFGEGAPRLLTIRAYEYLYDRGILAGWRDAAIRGTRTVEPNAPALPEAAYTGVSAAEMLAPMPGVDRDLRQLTGRSPASFVVRPKAVGGRSASAATGSPVLKLWSVQASAPPTLASGPLDGAGAGAFLDPVKAEANGWLTLREGRDEGVVIALVRDTTEPIFLPAGQLLSGGKADRVVAQPTWLPPSRGERPHLVPCRVVENYPDGDAKDAPHVTPWIAGPSIRALLAAGASQEAVKAAARAQVDRALQLSPWSDWSLLRVYGGKAGQRNLAEVRRHLRWSDQAGFVVTDADGHFVGAEILRLRGPAAEELLTRLCLSYVAEASLRQDAPAFATPGEDLQTALRRMAQYEVPFRVPAGFEQPEGARVSTLEVRPSGLYLHALEVGDRPAMVSSLRGPSSERR